MHSAEPMRIPALLADPDTSGFARAWLPRPFVFPQDHGPHPEYKTEWWYYTGNLVSRSGDRYGFQLTFFRANLGTIDSRGTSAWRTNQMFMAHFAVSDIADEKFVAFERLSRAANGLAGARAQPYAVWLEDWRVEAEAPGQTATTVRLSASEDDVSLRLLLVAAKSPILQGVNGLSQKGLQPGNASYYYSLSRLSAEGTIRLGDRQEDVTGTAWMDREWSTSALESGQTGWDWFALQLDDTTEIMYYQLRRDGSVDPHSRGALVKMNGDKIDLLQPDVLLTVRDWWDSPLGGRYPSGWTLQIPKQQIELSIEPMLREQELDGMFRYWEGAVRVQGVRGEAPVAGAGYVELTGYSEPR